MGVTPAHPTPPPTHTHTCTHTPIYTFRAWPMGVFLAAQTLLNDQRHIMGILKAVVCLYDPPALP